MEQTKLPFGFENVKTKPKEKAKEKVEYTDDYLKKKKEEFESKYNYGSTTVWLKDGKYYFYGDVSHNGREAIKSNAKKIRDEMIRLKAKYGHMNYNDLPTFDKKRDIEPIEKERANCYHDDLYVFEGDEIKIDKLMYAEEQDKIY